MKENIIQLKSFDFAIRIIKLHKFLTKNNKEYTLSKQLLRSGTSIGANIEEALAGSSRKDFIHKMTIALKETRETHYWIRLLNKADYVTDRQCELILQDCDEIIKILTKIIKSSKK